MKADLGSAERARKGRRKTRDERASKKEELRSRQAAFLMFEVRHGE
jgi:hypothetical protein